MDTLLDTPEILYRDIGGAKQLCSKFVFSLPKNTETYFKHGFITVRGQICEVHEGYTWDGASGPTIDTVDSVCASLGHDVMYELMGQNLISQDQKAGADFWFYERLIKDGMIQFRALYWYKAVCIFGIPGYSDDAEIKRAPKPFKTVTKKPFQVIPNHFVTS
jgi:hypothetical protein